MNHYQFCHQFGSTPDLAAVLVFSLQKALKGYRIKHPDVKRQRSRKERDLAYHGRRQLKRNRGNGPSFETVYTYQFNVIQSY